MKLTSSPKLNVLLFEMGILSYFDVLEHLPRKYESYAYTPKEDMMRLRDKDRVVLLGKIIGERKTLRFAKLSNTRFYFHDQYGVDHSVIAWNRPYLSKILNNNDEYTLMANFDARNHCLNMVNIKKGRIEEGESLVPVYSLPKEYPSASFRLLVKKALSETAGKIDDRIPPLLENKYKLISREEAFKKVHFPTCLDDIHQGQRTLKYEEALIFSIRNQLIRKDAKAKSKDERRKINFDKLDSFIKGLPFPLTNDQSNAIKEALTDMDSPSLMYRLLQGDVGTGKTMVAASLLYANYTRSEQGVILAPTDALAKQHYQTINGLFSPLGIRVALLVGSLSRQERKAVLDDLRDGTIDVLIGTHAVFSNDVEYAYLGLAIIDEQHKFGVSQRTTLANKGEHADLLLMSATPIPRTLSLTIFGDLDVSIIKEFPNKERHVETRIVKSNDAIIDKAIKRSLEIGGRVYVVAPQIEENGQSVNSSVKNVYEAMNASYPGKVALLHGKQTDEEKLAALTLFRMGINPIIVSTSIIEVGIDVKEANMMVVYEASHFSLSGLHQLRGRIGRNGNNALCLLVNDDKDEGALDKLNVLVDSNDGFYIAEEDLRRRGPGEIAGKRQSGLSEFSLASIVKDIAMFEAARDDAAYLLAHEGMTGASYIVELAKKENEGYSLA